MVVCVFSGVQVIGTLVHTGTGLIHGHQIRQLHHVTWGKGDGPRQTTSSPFSSMPTMQGLFVRCKPGWIQARPTLYYCAVLIKTGWIVLTIVSSIPCVRNREETGSKKLTSRSSEMVH